jgi:hypothetical protein
MRNDDYGEIQRRLAQIEKFTRASAEILIAAMMLYLARVASSAARGAASELGRSDLSDLAGLVAIIIVLWSWFILRRSLIGKPKSADE